MPGLDLAGAVLAVGRNAAAAPKPHSFSTSRRLMRFPSGIWLRTAAFEAPPFAPLLLRGALASATVTLARAGSGLQVPKTANERGAGTAPWLKVGHCENFASRSRAFCTPESDPSQAGARIAQTIDSANRVVGPWHVEIRIRPPHERNRQLKKNRCSERRRPRFGVCAFGLKTGVCLGSLIHVAAWADVGDHHAVARPVKKVDNAQIAVTEPVETPSLSGHRFDTRHRQGIAGQLFEFGA
jgi:hypothetical protein